jgi:hypothetical protein
MQILLIALLVLVALIFWQSRKFYQKGIGIVLKVDEQTKLFRSEFYFFGNRYVLCEVLPPSERVVGYNVLILVEDVKCLYFSRKKCIIGSRVDVVYEKHINKDGYKCIIVQSINNIIDA